MSTSYAIPSIDSFSGLDRWLIRKQFTLKARTELYGSLGVLIDNRIHVLRALHDMHAAASDDGRNLKAVQAVVIGDLIETLSDGGSFAKAIGRWVGSEEAAIISSGEQAGRLREAFQEAIALLEYQERIRGAVKSMVTYPSVLGIAVIAMLYIVSAVVVPKLYGVADPSTWEGFAKALNILSELVMDWGIAAGIVLVMAVVSIGWSMANYTGPLRRTLDRLVPWSIYREINGCVFLLNLSVMLRSGIKLQDCLITLEQHANPWLSERINDTLRGIAEGRNFGEALRDTGHGFPDSKSIHFVRTLASVDGFDKGLHDFAKSQIKTIIASIEGRSKSLFFVALMLVASLVLLVVGATTDIQSAIDASINAR